MRVITYMVHVRGHLTERYCRMENWYFVIIVPLIAVFLLAGFQNIDVNIETDIVIERNIETVYNFAKNPDNQRKLQQTM